MCEGSDWTQLQEHRKESESLEKQQAELAEEFDRHTAKDPPVASHIPPPPEPSATRFYLVFALIMMTFGMLLGSFFNS